MSFIKISDKREDFFELISNTHNSTPLFVVFVKAIFFSSGDQVKKENLPFFGYSTLISDPDFISIRENDL